MTLDCSAPSVPPAIFSWKFNNTLTDVKTAQYLIDMALYKNTGTYTCEAYNAVTGKSTAQSHFLSVKGEVHVSARVVVVNGGGSVAVCDRLSWLSLQRKARWIKVSQTEPLLESSSPSSWPSAPPSA